MKLKFIKIYVLIIHTFIYIIRILKTLKSTVSLNLV